MIKQQQQQRAPLRTRVSGTSKSNTAQIKTFSDLVKSLIKRQTAPKTRASRLWAKLREHVKRGFFESLLNQAEAEPDSFLENIETLWSLVHKHSTQDAQHRNNRGQAVDSTTEFVTAGWSRIKEAQFTVNSRARSGESDDARVADADARDDFDNAEVGSKRGQTGDTAGGKRATSAGGSMPKTISSGDGDEGAVIDIANSSLPVTANDIKKPNESENRKEGTAESGLHNSPTSASSAATATAPLRSGFGIEGLSFDTVPNAKITSELRIIAEGLYSQPWIEADFYTVQVNFNRGWKLLLLGLTQAESLSRFMAMCALRIAIPVINDTLLDYTTRQNILLVLVNLMISDERQENRLKAVYLIGKIASELGLVREHDGLLLRVFKELIKKLIELQCREKKLAGADLQKYRTDTRPMKIYLIHAIGKFTCNLSQNSRYMEDLTIYALQNEFEYGDTKLELKSDGSLKKSTPTGALFVVKSLLGVIVNDIKPTEQNEKYIGAVFKSYVSPLLKVSAQRLQVVAVQFVSNWLPITNEDNSLLALDTLQSGLKLTRDLGIESFDKKQYDKEMAGFRRKLLAEESRIALRTKLLRQLLLVPGTFSRLKPVPEHPGFFADNDTGMSGTKAIAVGLPIHPKSNVLISRPIPSIPGVPPAVTTIPPIFMEPAWFEKIPPPACFYESLEKTGGVPGLPVGYTYSPNKLLDVYAIKGIEKAKKAEPEHVQPTARKASVMEFSKPKARTTAMPPKVVAPPSPLVTVKRFPYGDSKSAANDDEEEDAVGEMDDGYVAPTGFGFVKRRGTLVRIDIERSGDNSDVLPIPTGTTKTPPKEDGIRFESLQRGDGIVREGRGGQQHLVKKVPPGFLNLSPFPGFDPDDLDRTLVTASAIYARADLAELDGPTLDNSSRIPSGCTTEKNPVLWPSKNTMLKPANIATDFPMFAPVLFEIIQPGNPSLQQILCQVVGIDKDVSAVDLLSAGATFNIFIRSRSNLSKWSCINLQVIDDAYRDGSNLRGRTSMQSLNAISPSNTAIESSKSIPIPAGFTSNGEPYFAPAVNVPPIPAGYTAEMVPYYGKGASVKPQPLGMTTDGIRFYNTDGSINEPNRNQVGGYDNYGQPFFVPKGCSLPSPVGFTPDGIAYFDIPSILNQRGIMLLPVPPKDRMNWPKFEEDDDSVTQLEVTPDGRSVPKKFTSEMLLHDLLTALKITQSEIKKTLVADRSQTVGTVRRLRDIKDNELGISSDGTEDMSFQDPEDVISYLKDGDEFAHLKSPPIRVALDPAALDFQSVYSSVTKNAVLRYRANRGDRDERDFFIAVEPAEIFSVPQFHLRLQGEGVFQISVTFNPILLHTERVEGALSLIDEMGNKLVSCILVGLRQSFIKITPSSIDAGWMLPERRKDISLKIENLSSVPVSLSLELSSEANSRAAIATAAALLKTQGSEASSVNERTVDEMKKKGFVVPTRSVKLQPSESKTIPVYFEPYNLGRFTDGIEVTAPGGDLIKVPLSGVAGIPIALYPETAENSLAGGEALTLERGEFMKKFRKGHSGEKDHTPLTDIDVSILQNMMSATADSANRRQAHTVDFGICTKDMGPLIMRCVTVMNLSDNAVSLGLFPHLSALKCKYIVKIPPRSATTVEITLDMTESPLGNIKTAIEVICPEFQNIPLYINAFVGQPLYFNCWDIAYFRPCSAGVTDHIYVPIINESQYDIRFSLDGLDSKEQMTDGISYFTSSFSDNESELSMVPAFGSYSVNFGFTGRQRGPWMKTIRFKLGKEFNGILLAACPSGNPLTLVGICVESWAHQPGDSPDKNGLEILRMWMSHPKRVIDEYSVNDSERSKRFSQMEFPGYKPREKAEDLDVVFVKEEIVFRQMRKKTDDPLAARRAQVQSLLCRNKQQQEIPAIWLSSTLFMIEPRAKSIRPLGQELLDIMFVPPQENIDNVPIYGFAAALSDLDHRFHCMTLMSKPASDFLIFPYPDLDGNIILDFGRLETSTNGFDVNCKWLTLVNTFPQSFSWNLKFGNSRTKYNPFDAETLFGELEQNESIGIPFTYKCDTSGAFETIAELTIKNTLDRLAKPIKLANIILRTQSVTTSLGGFPESIEFGSTVVFHKKKRKFTLTNTGTVDTKVSLFCRGSFSISPKTFSLYPKASQQVTITFAPTESRTSATKVHVFANQKLYMIPVTGSGGTADLICDMYGSKDIDFGLQKEGTVAWVSLYLTNKGTLPLSLNMISATKPDLIKLEYCSVTSTVPYSNSHANKNPIAVRKNYWGILQRKFAIFMIAKGLTRSNKMLGSSVSNERRKLTFIDDTGVNIPIVRAGISSTEIIEHSLISVIPELRPFYSYHLRLGYLNKYQPSKDTEIHFHYMPITSEEEGENLHPLLREMTLKAVGKVFRSLEFYPTSFDFGITPVETRSLADSWKMTKVNENKDQSPKQTTGLEVINMSLEAQNVTLDFISSEFKISGKTWGVNPGEKIFIPVEFHPPKEQTQYRGEARFTHNNEKQTIILTGTGASADISADDAIDFGRLKLGAVGQHKLRICNRGLLDSRFVLDIIQKGTDFRFVDEEPYEYEGVLATGTAQMIEIECCCQSVVMSKCQVVVKWERIPNGAWEQILIPLLVQTGLPVFRLHSIELDFKTTYVNVNKTLEFAVTNDGNASCYWALESVSPLLKVEPESGTIPPGDTVYIEVTFIPEDFEQLAAEMVFYTDAGRKVLMCYGLVGVPYLSIPPAQLQIDYGISAVDKPQLRTIEMTNTGSKPIQYEIVVTNMTENGLPTGADFEVFFLQPANGILPANTSQTVRIQAIPKRYGSTVSANFVISTRDGERYVGKVQVTGGRAIIKIAPPTFESDDSQTSKIAEISDSPPKHTLAKRASLFEMTRLAFQQHVENLQDVLAGLRTEHIEQSDVLKTPKSSGSSKGTASTTTPSSPTKLTKGSFSGPAGDRKSPAQPDNPAQLASLSPRKRRDLQMLQKAEAMLQERLGNEEVKRQTASSTVFDGSDLRAKVNRAIELANTRGYKHMSPRNRPKTEPGTGKESPSDIESAASATLSRANTSHVSKAAREAELSQMQSEKYLQDLASLESDLEILHAVIKSVNGSADSLASTPSSGSRLSRYNAGSSKKSRQGVISGFIPTSPTKRDYGSRGVRLGTDPNTPFSRAQQIQSASDGLGEPQSQKKRGVSIAENAKDMPSQKGDYGYDTYSPDTESSSGSNRQEEELESQDSKSGSGNSDKLGVEPSGKPRFETSGKVAPGSIGKPGLETRGKPGFDATGKPVSEISGKPASEGSKSIQSRSKSSRMSTTDSQRYSSLQGPLDELVHLAHFYNNLITTEMDPTLQKRLVDEINNQLVANTAGVIKLVKGQLSNAWVANREFLSSALKAAQQSAYVIEALSQSKPEKQVSTSSDFNLGLIRAGDQITDVRLFNLPNMGNLALDFKIVRSDSVKIRPEEFPESEEAELFVLSPMEGIIDPGLAINFSTNFLARAPGFYQQAFELESAGEKIISFTITGMAGVPFIQVEPKLVEFGLVCRNKFDIRSITISNTGSFKDHWQLESLNADDESEKTFVLNSKEGMLDPKQSTSVDIKFAPKKEGNFSNHYRLRWTGEPRLIEAKGVGGGARLKFTFVELEDLRFAGFDWGTTVVGLSYSKEIIVSNVGNVEGFFHLAHPNALFRFDLALDSNGDCRLDPGASIKFKIHFSPLCSEKINESFQLHLMDSPVTMIASRLVAGTKIWAVDGTANFKNMSIKDTQTVRVNVLNAGTLEIPFEYAVQTDDPEMERYFSVSVPDAKQVNGRIMIPPSQELQVSVKITPKPEHQKIKGCVVLKTELGPGPTSETLSFDFWTYDKQLSLDDSKDTSVGRVLVGEVATVERTLTNFGSDRAHYRIRLEPVPESLRPQLSVIEDDVPELKGGKKKPAKTKRKGSNAFLKKIVAWKIQGEADGYLECNDSCGVSVVYEALEEHGDDWQEAMMIIDKCEDESGGVWNELTAIKISGAAGTPKLELSQEEIDFGVTGKDIGNTKYITLRNEGNALLSYEFELGWDYSGNIFFENEALISGKIVAGESVDVGITFKPNLVQSYETQFHIKTQLDEKTVRAFGQGALFKFLKSDMPPVLNIGRVFVGSIFKQDIKIYNDCIYDISVRSKLLTDNPDDDHEAREVTEFIAVDPPIIELLANGSENPTDLADRSFAEYSLIAHAPITDENVDNAVLNSICNKVGKKAFLLFETIGGDLESGKHCLPVTFRFSVYNLMFISTPKYSGIKKGEVQPEETEGITAIDFGEVGYETGASMVMVLYNQNPFKVTVDLSLESSGFAIYPSKATLGPNSGRDFRVELKPLELVEGDEVESSITRADTLKVSTNIELVAGLAVSVTGTFIDEPEPLEFSEPLDFGSVRRLFHGEAVLEFRNPVRRSLPYKFSVERDYRDIFQLELGNSSISGVAKPRSHVRIPIRFIPKLGTEYIATGTLETDERNFLISLKGSGVEPAIELSETKIDFGIVGVDAAEFREVDLRNASKVGVKIGVVVSGDSFSVEGAEGELRTREFQLDAETSETVRIICKPTELSSHSKGKVEFQNLDLAPGQKLPTLLGSIALESIGGTCAFSFTSADEDDEGPVYDSKGSLVPKTPVIHVNFTKVIMGQRVRKYFEVENCGDTMVDLVITDVDGKEAKEDVEMTAQKAAFSFSPAAVVIKPHTKQKFAVIAKGLKVGEESHTVHVKTRKQLDARIIPIKIKANVLSPESQLADGLKVFSRVDNSIDGLLGVKGPTEESLNSDLQLWKIYIPVIRVNLMRPSQELQCVDPVEPNTVLPDIGPFVIRPPALPRDVPQKAKKWFANRTSMSLDAKGRSTPGTISLNMRKEEALSFVRPVEKQVFVEKKGAERRRMSGFY
ncbi:hypothetical protein HDU77_000417 [Chytriomyces hyalinus]|nr:hypothetical protein HDU77_000417 [Chytriomyces hyalinus]